MKNKRPCKKWISMGDGIDECAEENAYPLTRVSDIKKIKSKLKICGK